jgi:hypothetical protein
VSRFGAPVNLEAGRMNGKSLQSERLSLRPLRVLALVISLLPFGMSFSVVVAPLISRAEITENRTSERERSEELSADARQHHVRQLLVSNPRCGEDWIYPAAPKITQRQNGLKDIFSGHRLSHDLLAPMTC